MAVPVQCAKSQGGNCEPELAHPLWNSMKRSVAEAGLQERCLKLSIVSNFKHGSWPSGDKRLKLREALHDPPRVYAEQDRGIRRGVGRRSSGFYVHGARHGDVGHAAPRPLCHFFTNDGALHSLKRTLETTLQIPFGL